MKPKSNSQTTAPESGKQRPTHEIRLGRIRATIWQNQRDNATWYNVTLSRLYKDGEELKSTASFGRDDLLTVVKVADLANTVFMNRDRYGAPLNFTTPDDLRSLDLPEDLSPWNRAVIAFLLALPAGTRIVLYWC